MKKTLIAMAVAGIVAAPAQAGVYGSVKEVIKLTNTYNTGADGAKDLKNDPRGSVYVLGIKGTKELNNGLTGGYKFAITNDGEGSAIKKDTSSLSLKGGFGTVYLGNTAAATKIAAHYLNDSTSSWNSTVKNIENAGQDGLRYQSPNFSGFTGNIVLGSNDGDTDKDGASASAVSLTGIALDYTNGGIKFTYATQAQDSTADVTDMTASGPMPSGMKQSDDRTAMTLGWSGMGIGVTYSTATQKEKSGTTEDTTIASGITLSYKMSANKFLLGMHSTQSENTSVGVTKKDDKMAYTSLKYVRTLGKGSIFFFETMTMTGTDGDRDSNTSAAKSALTMIGVKHSF